MAPRTSSSKGIWVFVFILFVAFAREASPADKRPLTFEDLMKFHTIHDTVISRDGAWIAYGLKPDRGDGEAVVRSTTGETEYRVERGREPVFSSDSRWAGMAVSPTFEELENSQNDEGKEKPRDSLALLRLRDGDVARFDRVEKFAFSDDGKWLAYKRHGEDKSDEQGNDEDKKKEDVGTALVLRELESGREVEIAYVTEFSFDEPSKYLAYAVAGSEGEENGLFLRHLTEAGEPEETLSREKNGRYTCLTWAKDMSRLAFVSAVDDDKEEPGHASLWTWDGQPAEVASSNQVKDGWYIPSNNGLDWSRDGGRLFFGIKPEEEPSEEEKDEDEPFDPYDRDRILARRGVDVWHWNDPLIVTHQKEQWNSEKDRTYRAVYHLGTRAIVPLADAEMRNVEPSENPDYSLGLADVPYLKRITWDGRYRDVYVVSLADGSKTLVTEELEHAASLAPGGRYVVFYDDQDWHLYDVQEKSHRNLTEAVEVPFADEDHDYPEAVPGYGIGGWVEEDRAVLIYDKYDIWQFPTDGGRPINLTGGQGRENGYTFRVLDLDKKRDFLGSNETLLLSAYHQKRKNWGFYRARVGGRGVERLLEEDKKFHFLAKAEDADRIIYTRESYTEFPDIWTAGMSIEYGKKLSEANPQIAEFAWGSAELVEWNSMDGIPLQGVLIKPGNYEPGKRYPVLVYFYRFFSQRLNEFNEPVVNHRPSFPLYASNGYTVFLPDVRFEIGSPGFSATKCIVPGVQKLIDMGIADPGAVGLHGHSWSGYQTAFVVTQTDIFAAAVAGAPVSNMTSAYSGIRWESGLARQFQYEKTQSRIGGSLWEYPERYIENSPVFFADKIDTPLLTMFGDVDGAVPWYQGIELYLAMRRLGKESIFLQYRDEPHHPQKYANKLDYSIKMKQFLDHYLKGEPAPDWITKGVPYRGQ